MRLLRNAVYGMLLLASTCLAQTKVGDVVADIPFPFIAGGQTLPAGHYIVSPLSETIGIHDLKNQGTFVPTHSEQRSASDNSCKIVFHRYGDTFFFSEVWVRGNMRGRAVFPSNAEHEMAARGAAREITVVAAK